MTKLCADDQIVENGKCKAISNPTTSSIDQKCFQDTTDDFPPLLRFLFRSHKEISFFRRIKILRAFNRITQKVDCPHTQDQILQFIISVMSIPHTEGCIVEAGTYKGGGAAKFSIIAKLLGRRLIIFDSFEGLPQNEENHEKSILGHSIQDWFRGGNFRGTIDEVIETIETYGQIEVCTFKQGWFEETMPIFKEKICALYIDCDLASSTKTVLKWLYPLVIPGGIVFSQDGDFPLVIDVFDDDQFWQTEVGCVKPHIVGLRSKKLLYIVKPINGHNQ